MAGDWMKIEKVTPDKPEIDGIATILDLDPDAVFGKCFRIWRWFDDHTTDGNAPSVTKNAIDRRAGVTGFADAMEKVGWLVTTGDSAKLPSFDRHNGETSKARALTAKRVAAHKSKGNAKGNASGNGEVTDGALPREEKRRDNTPYIPQGGLTPIEEFNQDRRSRERYKPFVGDRTDLANLKAWVRLHDPEVILRDPATFSQIVATSLRETDELAFYQSVARVVQGYSQ